MIFAISGQSPGHVQFSVGVDAQHAPQNLSVTNLAYDENSQVISQQEEAVSGWVENPGVGWSGFADFDSSAYTGAKAFALVHKGNSPNALAVFSYIAP